MIQRLKPWISAFSAEISNKKYENGTEVKVGGTILNILDFSTYELDLEKDDIETYVTIDDSIGTTDLLFMKDTFKLFDSFNFAPGQVILAEGNVLKTVKRIREDANLTSSSQVICWDIKPIEKVEEKI